LFKADENDEVYLVKTSGPTILSYNNKLLKGHGKDHHKNGFSSPVGRLKGYDKPLEDFSMSELKEIGIQQGHHAELSFTSGINVTGSMTDIIAYDGKIQLITFKNCTVTGNDGEILFDPSWGVCDMAVGEEIISVFCGAADKDAYEEIAYKSNTGTHRVKYDTKTQELHKLYQQVRDCRQQHAANDFLGNVWHQLQIHHHDDWLCALEILEILDHEEIEQDMAAEITVFLEQKALNEPHLTKLVKDGFYLIKHPVEQKLVV
jgi:phenylalanine-4-hydroxylase